MSESPDIRNGRFLSATPSDKLVPMMLTGLQLDSWGGKDDRLPVTLYVDALKEIHDPALVERIQNAVVSAIAQWDPQTHSRETLENLALTVGFTQNRKALSALIDLIDHQRIPDQDDRDDVYQTREYVISVVSGFAPDDEAKEALLRWFRDDEIPWVYTALIVNGLITCFPEQPKPFVKRFLDTVEAHPDYFAAEFLTCEIAGTIGPDKLESLLIEDGSPAAKQLLSYMPEVREILEESKEE